MSNSETATSNDMIHYEIAQSLVCDYEAVYYIDLVTGAYAAYEMSSLFKRIGLPEAGDDFFEDTRRGTQSLIYESDRTLVIDSLKRETIEEETGDGDELQFECRIYIDEKPVFHSCKVVRSVVDPSHVIVSTYNINREKELELEFNTQLQQAREQAQRDELTRVRNRNAYIEFESEISASIANGELKEFALVISDLNDLKTTNDQLGHAAGDTLLKNACHTICVVFDHSPVFRIGGDEFVCVLRGHDYVHRDELYARLGTTSAEAAKANQRAGVAVDVERPVVACGMSAFDPSIDSSVESVFRRADAAMYESKKRLKESQQY